MEGAAVVSGNYAWWSLIQCRALPVKYSAAIGILLHTVYIEEGRLSVVREVPVNIHAYGVARNVDWQGTTGADTHAAEDENFRLTLLYKTDYGYCFMNIHTML